MKSITKRRFGSFRKRKNISHENIITNKYVPIYARTIDNINDYTFNDTLHVDVFLAKYYQKKDSINCVLTSET